MLTFKRALIGAAFFLTMLYLVTRTHTNPSTVDRISLKDENIKNSGFTPTNPATTTGKMPAFVPKKQRPGQQVLADMSRAPLHDKLSYQFPYDVESKFPAYIWQ